MPLWEGTPLLVFLTCRGSFVCIHSSFPPVKYKAFIHFLHILLFKKAIRKTTGLCCLTTALTAGTPARHSKRQECAWISKQPATALGTARNQNLPFTCTTTQTWILQLISWLPGSTRFYSYVMKHFKYVDLHVDMALKETTKQWLKANSASCNQLKFSFLTCLNILFKPWLHWVWTENPWLFLKESKYV